MLNFETALAELKNDKHLALENWNSDEYVCIEVIKEQPTLIKRDRYGSKVYRPAMEHFFAINWVIR